MLLPGGEQIGEVSHVRVRRARYHVEGRIRGHSVTLQYGLSRTKVVVDGQLQPNGAQFKIDLPLADGVPRLMVEDGNVRSQIDLPEISSRARLAASRRLWPRFSLTLASLLPPTLRWTLTQDPAARAQIKRGLGFSNTVAQSALDPAVFKSPPAVGGLVSGSVTLVVPVFAHCEVLPEFLDRIVRNTDLPWRILFIDDDLPDPASLSFLRSWVDDRNTQHPGQARLIQNTGDPEGVSGLNAAFGVALEYGDHAVLLNPGVFVPHGWASRLLGPIHADPSIASVNPMSNDANLLSVPVLGNPTTLTPGMSDQIDDAASALGRTPTLPILPTGVEFCMAINISFLRMKPQFDPAIANDQVAAVDWCRAVARLGGRHCCQPGLFVGLHGVTPSEQAERASLSGRSAQTISARYPNFDRAVEQFVRNDPLLTQRLALACAWAGAQATKRVPIFLAHSMDGGAEAYLRARIGTDLRDIGCAVVLRVGGPQRWLIELHAPSGVTKGATFDFSLIERLLAPIQRRRIVYSCGVGDPYAAEIPDHLRSLKRNTNDRLEVLFHDYFAISPSQNLLDSRGSYDGVPDAGNTDRAHTFKTPDGRRMSLIEWRRTWEGILQNSDELVVFSQDSRDHVLEAYPGLASRIIVRPHPLSTKIRSVVVPNAADKRPVIGVLGNIGRHKGAAVVSALSSSVGVSGVATLVLIGTLDPAFRKAGSTLVHGTYQTDDIPDLVHRYGITCWLVPSIWPETFSFTTHEALATRLPVYGFDIGAQAEALRAAQNGRVLQFRTNDLAATVLDAILSEPAHTPPPRDPRVLSQA